MRGDGSPLSLSSADCSPPRSRIPAALSWRAVPNLDTSQQELLPASGRRSATVRDAPAAAAQQLNGDLAQWPCTPASWAEAMSERSSGKWQAAKWPGDLDSSSGISLRQRCWSPSDSTERYFGQRVWKTQPDGGLIGLGRSPTSRIRSRLAS